MSDPHAAYDALLEHVQSLMIVDTHEHLPAREADRCQRSDVIEEWLTHYFSCDLISAGMPHAVMRKARDSQGDLMKRWRSIEPFWQAARSTGYGRALELCAQGLYGIDEISRKTIGPLNEAFQAARDKGGHYDYVLKEKSRVALSIVDENLECDRRYFASVVRFDTLICPDHRLTIEKEGDYWGVRVHCLEDWEEVMRRRLDGVVQRGAVAIKSALAYKRSLHYPKTSRHEADQAFSRLWDEVHSPEWRPGPGPSWDLQNYLMHRLCALADERGLAMQFHTGLQEGNGNYIVHANPAHLSNLMMEYRNVRFDLFHMGYPYILEMGNLAKNFANCYIDMCWGHIISPATARRALIEWLDAVPANKISAFGGDYCFVDGVYGHTVLARQNVAAALTQKVHWGVMDLDRAKQVATWLLVDNPARLFDLTKRIKDANKPKAKKARGKKK